MNKEARKWIGYLEHSSNNFLELYTANIGKGGCTIFSLIICRYYPRLNFSRLPWCVTFVHAIGLLRFGKSKAAQILGKPCASSKLLLKRMRQKGLLRESNYVPKEGDLIFFQNSQNKVCHVGIVDKIEGDQIVSIEGNTVDPSGHFEKSKGGAVAIRVRNLDDAIITCYAAISELY